MLVNVGPDAERRREMGRDTTIFKTPCKVFKVKFAKESDYWIQ